MKNKIEVILSVIFVTIFLGYILIDSYQKDKQNQKIFASLKEGVLIGNLDCKLASTAKNFYYDCNIQGFNIGTISFLELAKGTSQPVTASSNINLPDTKLKVYYSLEF